VIGGSRRPFRLPPRTSEFMTLEEWLAIIKMLMEERHRFLLEELRQLARDKA
jgi:hypothetical protein